MPKPPEPATDPETSGRYVLIIQHVPWETPGALSQALDGIPTRTTSVAAHPEPVLPPVTELAGLVVLGGPMNADDITRFPGLAAERRLLADAVETWLPTLGICLGGQLLACALGAELEAGSSRELGWAPVSVHADDDPLVGGLSDGVPVLHWHSDSVTLPHDAQLLASTPATPVQAFRVANAWGLQFHLEVTDELVASWLENPVMQAEAREALGTAWELVLTTHTAQALPILEQAAGPALAHFAELVRAAR